jgi:GNAT superfamily N-acetyltransferase
MPWRTQPRPDDSVQVGKLVAETGFFNAEEVLVAVELVDEALAHGPASGYEFVFRDDAGDPQELQGYTCYGPIPATVSSFDLYWIAVAPGHQGRGVGAALLRETERLARAAGATQMYADTSGRPQYLPTREFYERMGYTRAAVLKDFFAPGDDKVIYVHRLADEA